MAILETEVQESVRMAQREKNKKARELLRLWSEEGDEAEQRDTFDALKAGLNAHQSSRRVIYP